MTTFEYVKNLNAGWNLGNTLDSILRRKDDTRPHETAWGNPKTTQEMIQAVKDAGFDIFRVPVTWYQEMSGAPDFTINAEFLARVKEVIDYGINIGLTVIVNLHHENWYFPSEENFPAAKEKLTKIWTQLANYFADYPENLIFEAMNEPRKEKTEFEWTGGDEEGRRVVMKLNQAFVDTVRGTGGKNATRMLLVPNYAASCNENAMKDFVMPDGENLIMSLHGYHPYAFALGDDLSKNKWSESEKAEVDQLFARIDKYFLSKKIPVIMGETGAITREELGEQHNAERLKWINHFVRGLYEMGIPTIIWDDGGHFALLDRENVEWLFPELAAALVEVQISR
jgi:endoglucanase